jgi:hypothetical protein
MLVFLRQVVLPAIWLSMAMAAPAADSLPQQIDQLIVAGAEGAAVAPVADDAEFLRRIYLDLAGRIPTAQEFRTFVDDKRADKRTVVIDALLAGTEYPRRMQDFFHAMLMERRGDDPEWAAFLTDAFAANASWDEIARSVLDPDPENPRRRGAAYFYTKRLDKVGTQETDYAGVTRDVGRLFLGMDLQCAQCHNHLFIDDYKQQDFQGLFIVFQNTSIRRDVKFPAVGENLLTKKIDYVSVFDKIPLSTAPKVPGMPEMKLPEFKQGEEYLVPPDKKKNFAGVPRFSPLEAIAHELPTAKNEAFVRNAVNRLWFVMFGRGIVIPLDQHHKANPPSHPELLDLLAREFVAHKLDIEWFLRQLALTDAYQRSSAVAAGGEASVLRFTAANEKRLSAEQLFGAVLTATGPWPQPAVESKSAAETTVAKSETKAESKEAAAASPAPLGPLPEAKLRVAFIKAFANPPQEPEVEFTPSLKSSLFMLNDPAVLGLLTPQPGNLIERLAASTDADVAGELYRSVLTREPTDEERNAVLEYLKQQPTDRTAALVDLAWSLLASTEFAVNH